MTTLYGTPSPQRTRDALAALEAAESACRAAGLHTRADDIKRHVQAVQSMRSADSAEAEAIVIALAGSYTADDLPALIGRAANLRDPDLRAYCQRRLLNATMSALVRHTGDGR